MNIIALGLALVMAGTGDLETLSLFRGGRKSHGCCSIFYSRVHNALLEAVCLLL